MVVSIIIVVLVTFAFIGAIVKLIFDKKNGKHLSCGSNCETCPSKCEQKPTPKR